VKHYFYTDDIDKFGPFSLEELAEQKLTRQTKVWFFGLNKWTSISEIEELKSIVNSIPPELPRTEENIHVNKIVPPKLPGAQERDPDTNVNPPELPDIKENNQKEMNEKDISKNKVSSQKRAKRKKLIIRSIIIVCVSSCALIIWLITHKNNKEFVLYKSIAVTAFDADIDFDFYVDKFYRDLGVYGIFPKRPTVQIIKFASFDYIDDATHFHGISYGIDDDDRIEIYINKSSWDEFNKQKRYYLMYHELSHDVLNLDDLEASPSNEGKLMYPAIISYESITMDDFIEAFHSLFEELSSKHY
jgi:hypothetical protein